MAQSQYLTLDQLRQKLGGRGRSSIYRDIELGRLPKPIKLGARLYWKEADIEVLMNGLAASA